MSNDTGHSGHGALGVMISEFATPAVARVLDTLGYDFAIVDCEHGSFDFSQVAAICASAAGLRIEIFVRIPEIRREHVGKYLDMGATGLIAPMVSTGASAREVTRLAKYAPIGERGVSVTRAHSGYHVDNLAEYLAEANRRTKVFVQLETQEAFEHLDDIVAVSGLAGVIVGPNDLLQDLGVPGRNEDPRLAAYIQHAVSAARAAGLQSGIITSNRSLLTAGIDAGMSFICQGSDVSLMMAGARAARSQLGTFPLGG